MSLDTLLEAAKYLENIEQNGDTVRSGSSCSGSLSSSGGDRSPGGYLRLDPNLPISSQFHDYFCNPFLVSSSPSSSNLNGPKASSQHHTKQTTNSSSSPGRNNTSGTTTTTNNNNNSTTNNTALGHGRRGSKSVFAFSPGPRNVSISESSDGGGGLSEIDTVNGQTGVIVYSGSLGNVPPRPSSTTSSTGTNGRSRNSKLDPETSSRHREMHKTLEKNRRAQLRTCFEELRRELPKSDYSYKKSSHINIIHSAIRYIHQLKRHEWEQEKLYEELLRTKQNNERQLGHLQSEISKANGNSNSNSNTSQQQPQQQQQQQQQQRKCNSTGNSTGSNLNYCSIANSNSGTNLSNNCLPGGPAVSELIGALLKRAESKASGKSSHHQPPQPQQLEQLVHLEQPTPPPTQQQPQPQHQSQVEVTTVTKIKEETKESTGTVANVIASDDEEDDDEDEGEGHQLLIEERGEDETVGDEDDETTTTASETDADVNGVPASGKASCGGGNRRESPSLHPSMNQCPV